MSDRWKAVVLVEEDVLKLICGYALQSGLSLEEKLCFFDELKGEWDTHGADDLVMCFGDFNGHIGRHIDGFDEVHWLYGVGQRNLDGGMLLVLPGQRIMCVKRMVYDRRIVVSDIQTWRKWVINWRCVHKKRTTLVFIGCQMSNSWGVSTCASGSRYG